MNENRLYYAEYVPQDLPGFEKATFVLSQASTPEELQYLLLCFVLSPLPREDLMVALGRVERERGWKL